MKKIRITIEKPNSKYPSDLIHELQVIKKKWTPTYQCVEYDDYYEIACYSFYMRIDKTTLQVFTNRKDVDVFEIDNKYTAELIKVRNGG